MRVAQPENLYGLVDQLYSPAYSTSVGLLHWALLMEEAVEPRASKAPPLPNDLWEKIQGFCQTASAVGLYNYFLLIVMNY